MHPRLHNVGDHSLETSPRRGREKGGPHQKDMKGNIGRDPVFSRGDVVF